MEKIKARVLWDDQDGVRQRKTVTLRLESDGKWHYKNPATGRERILRKYFNPRLARVYPFLRDADGSMDKLSKDDFHYVVQGFKKPKKCKEGKQKDPKTGRCVKIDKKRPCKNGKVRSSSSDRCRKPCKQGTERVGKTCLKKCPSTSSRHSKTRRCRKN